MAYVGPFVCSRCGEKRNELVTHDRVCEACRIKEVAAGSKQRRVTLAGYKGLTVEERLERMEALLYDLAIQVNKIDRRATPEAKY